MSSLTNEWQLETGENSTKYIIYIDNFDKKIKTFSTGRKISSKSFKLCNSSFQVLIYPGGESDHYDQYVSVCLKNRSKWQVKAKTSFSVLNKNIAKSVPEQYFESEGLENTRCVTKFLPHVRCKRNDLLTNGVLAVEVDVELLQENILDNTDLIAKDATEKLQCLEKTVHVQTGQINQLQEFIEGMESRTHTQTNVLKNMIRELTMSLPQNILNKQLKTSVTLECPVCLEVAGPPMRLKQCGQGHILCDSCHARTEELNEDDQVGCPGLGLCPTCRQNITGRPTQLEKILGLI